MKVQNISKAPDTFGYDAAGNWIEHRLDPKEYVEVPNEVGVKLIANFADKYAEYGKGYVEKVGKAFQCPLCDRVPFDTPPKLGGHIRQKHGQEAFVAWKAEQD